MYKFYAHLNHCNGHKSAIRSLDAVFNRTLLLKDTLPQQIMVIRCITAYLYVEKITVLVIIIFHYTN